MAFSYSNRLSRLRQIASFENSGSNVEIKTSICSPQSSCPGTGTLQKRFMVNKRKEESSSRMASSHCCSIILEHLLIQPDRCLPPRGQGHFSSSPAPSLPPQSPWGLSAISGGHASVLSCVLFTWCCRQSLGSHCSRAELLWSLGFDASAVFSLLTCVTAQWSDSEFTLGNGECTSV